MSASTSMMAGSFFLSLSSWTGLQEVHIEPLVRIATAGAPDRDQKQNDIQCVSHTILPSDLPIGQRSPVSGARSVMRGAPNWLHSICVSTANQENSRLGTPAAGRRQTDIRGHAHHPSSSPLDRLRVASRTPAWLLRLEPIQWPLSGIRQLL